MARYLVMFLVVGPLLLLAMSHDVKTQGSDPDPHWIGSVCAYNHFSGIVYDCNHNPAEGETVTLRCPNGSVKTDVTNSEGRYCFAKPITIPEGSGWEPGYYGLETRCMVRLVYREGDGNIDVDLSVCCPKPLPPK